LIVDDDPYWTLFPAALRALVNLKELEFRNYREVPTVHVLRGCTFQLVSLIWECYNDENELSVFLTGQEALEQLRVNWRGKCAGPPTSALQNLSFLAGTSDAIRTFLPGRTITRLRWQPNFDEPLPDIIASISSALRNLHVLALDGPDIILSLSTIVDYLPNLRFLELVGHRKTDLLYIHRLPHLEGLVIYMMSIPSCQDLVMRLYSETKSLLFIDIYVNSSDIPVGYQRWCRDSTEPIQVTSTRWNGAWEDNLGDFSSHFDSGLLLAG